MRGKVLIGLSLVVGATFMLLIEEKEERKRPETFNLEKAESDPSYAKYKKEYLADLYRADSNTNVTKIRAVQRNERYSKMQKRSLDAYGNGVLHGEWKERGPINEAGDLQELDYNPQNNDLYAVSTVGHLFKGNLDKRSWVVLNDQQKLSTSIFEHILKSDNSSRLLTTYGSGQDAKKLRYSDDEGITWDLCSGFSFYDHWGSPKNVFEMSDGTLYFFVHTWLSSPWGAGYELYKSTDHGENFQLIHSITNSDNSGNNVKAVQYPKTDSLFIYNMNTKTRTLIGHQNSGTVVGAEEAMTGANFTSYQFNATGRVTASSSIHYVYSNSTLYSSADGILWNNLGTPQLTGGGTMTPWGKGKSFLANPNNNELYAGGFQFLKTSLTNELLWDEQYAYWWTYYDGNDANRKENMHVDITGIEYYEKLDGTPFIAVLNHAGLHLSYDNMATTENMGLSNLNCVTLYDHVTAADGMIYCGAQDKGTFSSSVGMNDNSNLFATDNQSTGDGMRELIYNNDKSFFGFLQNGFMISKADKSQIGGYMSWQVPGDDIPGWINPVENHPDPAAKKCYVAGGNLNGGPGSYLIEMNVSFNSDGSNFQWQPIQYNYDFKANSRNGKSGIKAIGASKSDYDRLYVATNDASFFTSSDGGANWSLSTTVLPATLMPWDIAVNTNHKDSVFICGTGWSNAGVYMSVNGGVDFVPLSTQAISATYYDIVLSDDNQFLFAATSEGPVAYDLKNETWFDLISSVTPTVDFRSVEYISNESIVRFGTYGRGIWDFKISPNSSVSTKELIGSELRVYPNPTQSFFSIEGAETMDRVEVVDFSGKLVLDQKYENRIQLESFKPGVYVVKLYRSNQQIASLNLLKK